MFPTIPDDDCGVTLEVFMKRQHLVACLPAGLTHRCGLGPTAAGGPRLPHLPRLDPLHRFIRAQEQARHLSPAMVKALSTAQHVTRGGQTAADRLGDTNQRHHGGHPVSGGSRLRCSGSHSSLEARPLIGVGTRVDAAPSSRRCREDLLNIFLLQKELNVA